MCFVPLGISLKNQSACQKRVYTDVFLDMLGTKNVMLHLNMFPNSGGNDRIGRIVRYLAHLLPIFSSSFMKPWNYSLYHTSVSSFESSKHTNTTCLILFHTHLLAGFFSPETRPQKIRKTRNKRRNSKKRRLLGGSSQNLVQWLITMVSRSAKDRVVGPFPNDHSWLKQRGSVTTDIHWDDPPSTNSKRRQRPAFFEGCSMDKGRFVPFRAWNLLPKNVVSFWLINRILKGGGWFL